MNETPVSLAAASGIIRHKVLVRMRWFAVAGQLTALLFATEVLDLNLNLLWPEAIIAASALFNLGATFQMKNRPHLHNRGATISLAFDMLQLTVLLHVSGGLSNPFAVLILAPMVAGASLLTGRSVIILTTLGMASLTALLLFSDPLLWPDAGHLPPLFFAGAYVALVVTALFLVLYMRKVARESRRLYEALGASRLALAKEQKVSAFGALAAAVAHEMGSPLSTIAVIAKDLQHEQQPDDLKEDVALLNQQVERCRNILSDFGRYGMVDERSFAQLPLTAWLRRIAEPYQRAGIAFQVVVVKREGPEPRWPLQPALVHGVANPLQNAFSFAHTAVQVEISWQGEGVSLRIHDDGPGFPPNMLASLGDHHASMRGGVRGDSGHLGLGLFIAKSLLERSGANVFFANQTYSDGTVTGALVTLEWHGTPV